MTAGTENGYYMAYSRTPAANATSAAGNITMAGSGVATLTSTSTAETAWRVVFSGQSIQDPNYCCTGRLILMSLIIQHLLLWVIILLLLFFRGITASIYRLHFTRIFSN